MGDLLEEKKISAFSTWEKELHKIVFDPRYLLLTSKERKQVFDKYVRERAEEERKEKKVKAKEKKDGFRALCEEKNVTSKTSWSEFSREVSKDERFKAIDKSRDRESLFNEYQSEMRKRDREEKEEKRKILRNCCVKLRILIGIVIGVTSKRFSKRTTDMLQWTAAANVRIGLRIT